MTINKEKRTAFYALQKNCAQWLENNFDRYTANWQDFGAKYQYENYTCVKAGAVYLVLIVYKLEPEPDFYTYSHCVNFPGAAQHHHETNRDQLPLFVPTNTIE